MYMLAVLGSGDSSVSGRDLVAALAAAPGLQSEATLPGTACSTGPGLETAFLFMSGVGAGVRARATQLVSTRVRGLSRDKSRYHLFKFGNFKCAPLPCPT